MLSIQDPETFYRAVLTDRPVVAVFLADWCSDCHFILPSLPGLESRFAARIDFAVIDIDEQPQIARTHGVTGVPSFIVFRCGREVLRLVNPLRKTVAEIEDFLEKGLTLAFDACVETP